MQRSPDATRRQYDALLGPAWLWIAGGMEPNVCKNARFFRDHGILPADGAAAIDLGAGCGFSSLALAGMGYRVVAVDFCRPMLETLEDHAGPASVRTVLADILDFPAWAGETPALIVCTGDTLPHLPDQDSVSALIRRCAHELGPGGTLLISCRDYAALPEGSSDVIPVRQDPDRVFLCRLDGFSLTVPVTDILYTRESGRWARHAGSYTKLRLSPATLGAMVTGAGLAVTGCASRNGTITVIGKKVA